MEREPLRNATHRSYVGGCQDNQMALPKPALRGLLALGSVGALGAGALMVALAHGATLSLDPEVRTAVHSAASPGLTILMRGITQFGSWAWLTAVTLCLLVLFG